MFKIYALKSCNYCVKAVNLLITRQLPFFYCPMDGPPDGPEHAVTLDMIKSKYNWKTVPIIIRVFEDDEEFIGGYTDLFEYLKPSLDS